MALDRALLYWLNGFAGISQFLDTLIVFFSSYIQYILGAGLLLLLYMSTYALREKILIFGSAIFSVIIARFGIVELIRFFIHRPRPSSALRGIHELLSNDKWSFPSGHSAFFFALAASLYCYNKKWGLWFFAAALLMNISRVIAGVHYPSDILGGAIVGVVTAWVVVRALETKSVIKILKK